MWLTWESWNPDFQDHSDRIPQSRTKFHRISIPVYYHTSNSLYHGLPITQIKRLQHIQNGLARAVTRIPKHSHISPVLKSLHWLKVEQRIQYKIISIAHNLLHIAEPKYLHRIINIKPSSRTRSSDHLCLSLPPVSTRLKFADRSPRNSSPRYGTLYQ